MLTDAPIMIRPAAPADLPFMRDMLFEAAFTTDEQRAAWRRDPQLPPDLVKYLDGWGRTGDVGFIAIGGGDVNAGAGWYRLFAKSERGDGVLARADTPELAIAVGPAHRGKGVGEALMRALIRAAREGGHPQLMLSVDPANHAAIRLYERVGFARLATDDLAAGTSWMMVADLV